MPVQILPQFHTDGRVSYLVLAPDEGVAVLVDPTPGAWRRLATRATEAGCTVRAVLHTRPDHGCVPLRVPTIEPLRADGSEVEVRVGDRMRWLETGAADPVLRAGRLLIGMMVTSAQASGQLAFVIPAAPALVVGGRLCPTESDMAQAIGLIPEWPLGLVEGATVYTTDAPDGVYRRGVRDELRLRDTTRTRALRQLLRMGVRERPAVVLALGL